MNLESAMALYGQKKLDGRTEFQGMKISIENKKGSTRSGTDKHGKAWSTTMQCHYGYIRLTNGADGEHVDCYIGPDDESDRVFVVHQNDPDTGEYNEDKVMLGFNSAKEAKRMYLAHYNKAGFFGSMDELTVEKFKKKVMGKAPKKIVAFGEPAMADSSFHVHFDVIPTSMQKKQGRSYVPADDVKEKSNKFLDVTKRNSKGTQAFRNKLLEHHARPLPITTTAVEHHQGDATPFPMQITQQQV